MDCKCKFCPSRLPNYDLLKRHVINEHPKQYAQVSVWLGETDIKLQTHEILAKEGMVGHRDTTN